MRGPGLNQDHVTGEDASSISAACNR
jgi:hypothetical protein